MRRTPLRAGDLQSKGAVVASQPGRTDRPRGEGRAGTHLPGRTGMWSVVGVQNASHVGFPLLDFTVTRNGKQSLNLWPQHEENPYLHG